MQILPIFIILTILLHTPSTTVATPNFVFDNFKQLFLSVRKLIGYYEANYKYFNFDGVFGLVPLNGVLKRFLQPDTNLLQYLDEEWIHFFTKISQSIERIIDLSKHNFEQTQDPQYKVMKSLLDLPWTLHIPTPLFAEPFFSNLDANRYELDTLDKQISDACIIQLIRESSKQGSNGCIVSETCVNQILRKKFRDYGLTHQVLFLILMIQMKCDLPMDRFNHIGTVTELSTKFCWEILNDWKLGGWNSEQVRNHSDLILEQTFVCGSLGYLQFISLPLLAHILSWQHPSGCFSSLSDGHANSTNRLRHPKSIFTGRSLLTEKVHPDGCYSHTTSVAAAAMSVFVQAFLESPTYLDSRHSSLIDMVRQRIMADRNPLLPRVMDDDASSAHKSPMDDLPWNPYVSRDQLSKLIKIQGYRLESVVINPVTVPTVPLSDLALGILFLASVSSMLYFCLVFRRSCYWTLRR